MPALLFLLVNTGELYVILKIFDKTPRQFYNRVLFILILISLVLIVLVIMIMIIILVEVYRPHPDMHEGLKQGMLSYSNNSLIKTTIDTLQIEFQCCGNKKYDEWYSINWSDKNYLSKGFEDSSNGNTPFSCCSMNSLFPCIHHDIENTGTTYLYVPERNLSISTTGCYDSLLKTKVKYGWQIIGNLFLLMFLELLAIILLRFIQTAHFSSNFNFTKEKILYTMWLIGRYRGKIMVPENAPEPPQVPQDLMS
ncbi:peripherin-2 isoform X2 [Aethina tumida]|nr:peripherin-2 isoform X2 [Aethina tumida]